MQFNLSELTQAYQKLPADRRAQLTSHLREAGLVENAFVPLVEAAAIAAREVPGLYLIERDAGPKYLGIRFDQCPLAIRNLAAEIAPELIDPNKPAASPISVSNWQPGIDAANAV